MNIELGDYVRAKQDWLDRGQVAFTMGQLCQVIGFTLNSGATNVYLETDMGMTDEFPLALFPNVFEEAPSHAIRPIG